MLPIDWNAIRPLNGSSANGFEALCASLADSEKPSGSRFERKGPPDAGVECYAILADGSEWGWQAKYFNELAKSQWSQLDESVQTALKKHPRLVRYFVCLPLDLADPRIDKKRFAKDRWDEHVQKWQRWASDQGMAVQFVYWGSHQLLERLTRPERAGKVRFWFDVRAFDKDWFMARWEEARKTAGPRYTPEINIDLPIARDLETFGRTELSFDRIKACALGIRRELKDFGYSRSKLVGTTLDAEASALASQVQEILNELGSIRVQPIGVLPFRRISNQVVEAQNAIGSLVHLLLEHEGEHDAKSPGTPEGSATWSRSGNPLWECCYELTSLSSELDLTHLALVHAESVAGSALMLLAGAAGTGKTHLLCDIAKKRIEAGQPTVLLMGQRFVGSEAPWFQTLQQLDLPALSAEEFVGALEAAAEVADCRALVLIDAVNEGSGRLIWPAHLAAFLAHLERSPWIGVLLSVRSSYEDIVIPEEVRDRAVAVTHEGFADHEYDAARTFFAHYGLELPSTPLLSPEFRNPFFLKAICEGLNVEGKRRLPRGFRGITAIFDLYLSAVNVRLAEGLGFNPKDALVTRALEALARALVESGERWLTRAKASELVNDLLPGREFERSLFRGLVVEGVLVEDIVRWPEEGRNEVVFMGYDRFADQLVARALLEKSLGAQSADRGGLTGTLARLVLKIRLLLQSILAARSQVRLLHDPKEYVAPGVLEALCAQVPERTGQELADLYPALRSKPALASAFRQSLIWRDPRAFSAATRKMLNEFMRSEEDVHDTLDALLTLATLPEHPLNANFLHQRLRRDTMSERDAWWSIYLHSAWRTHGAVDRLVDWAYAVSRETVLEDETVDLCATVLSWMLSTSNRFLRDRATAALVSLLTDRLEAVVRLVERFADADDPYVVERVYAVAYGTAMRSHDTVAVGALAKTVYARVFSNGAPPPQILLRDYARGVVERAIHLGANVNVAVDRIRPPYVSQWPTVPTEDEIKPLLPEWSGGSAKNSDVEWTHNRIASSVMHDDFALYVIGTSSWSTNWLSLHLSEAAWQSADTRMAILFKKFSAEEKAAWTRFEAADEQLRHLYSTKWLAIVRVEVTEEEPVKDHSLEQGVAENDPDLIQAQQERDTAFELFESVMSKDHEDELRAILAMKENNVRPPRFDLRLIQRYVLRRVFDLGWTTERFGRFDRFSIGYGGRDASKAERIGKKYQWIAYHEIMALVADHFQYLEQFREDAGDQCYEGPWQEHLRDIDPSCPLPALPGGTSWHAHSPAWWGPAKYENWGDPSDPSEWVKRCDDLFKVEDLLSVTHPDDHSRWLNMQGYFVWELQPPADREWTEVERRDIWCICTGYLVRSEDADAFLKWAEGVDFWGRWMPDPPEVYQMFLGEYVWSPASRYFQQPYFGDKGWIQPEHDCPMKVRAVTLEYMREGNGFDCSVDKSYQLRLPGSELVVGLGLRWTGNGAGYVNAAGKLAVFDPTAHADGPSALLVREDLLKEFLMREKLSICWTILGEKRVIGQGFDPAYHISSRMTGAYVLGDRTTNGFLKTFPDRTIAE
jgi:hypothetical protein